MDFITKLLNNNNDNDSRSSEIFAWCENIQTVAILCCILQRLSIFVRRGDVPFLSVSSSPILRLSFLEQGIKRRQSFWSRLSKHAKQGIFVRSGYDLVQAFFFTALF